MRTAVDEHGKTLAAAAAGLEGEIRALATSFSDETSHTDEAGTAVDVLDQLASAISPPEIRSEGEERLLQLLGAQLDAEARSSMQTE
eukprot:6175712-Pleurochrysis_carterae.AAC.3